VYAEGKENIRFKLISNYIFTQTDLFRRRTVIEEELEMLYDAYYEELEHYEDENSNDMEDEEEENNEEENQSEDDDSPSGNGFNVSKNDLYRYLLMISVC